MKFRQHPVSLSNINIEQKYVQETYSKIAEHFDKTRVIIWKKVGEFIDNMKSNALVLDAGCGNGKNMKRKDVIFIGMDIEPQFCKIAKDNTNCETVQGSLTNIPFDDNLFDHIICIAVIHHLSSIERRREALKEIIRVLKPNSTALITAWKTSDAQQDYLVEWKLTGKYDTGDKQIIYRYYHKFIENEFRSLCENLNVNIIEIGEENDNYYIVIEKN